MNGTNTEDNGQSTVTPTDEADFDSVAKALFEGNSAELDRLVTGGEPAPKVEDEVKPDTEETPEVPETPVVEEKEEEVETPEAAEPAAPTAPAGETPAPDPRDVELHRLRSEAGRVPFIQRRIAELEREVRAAKARSPKAAEANTSPSATKVNVSDVQLDPETQKEIDELREVDPVMAKTLERIAKNSIAVAHARSAEAIETFTQQEQEADDQRFFLEQKAQLAQMVPRHEEIFASPEWRQWKETLTPGRRNLAESGYAEEVAQAIYAFAADMQARHAAPATPAAPAQAAAPVETPESREALEARNRKAGAAVGVKNPTAKKEATFNEDDYFKEIYNKLKTENHIS